VKHPIVVLSGPIAAGKSTLAEGLKEYGLTRVKTNELIESAAGRQYKERQGLQKAGDRLDRERSFNGS